jgi:uncharacterized protein (DUF111 family)
MKDRICEFECNIDDMTAEELAFAAERLMEEGARDVTLRPLQMKKMRMRTSKNPMMRPLQMMMTRTKMRSLRMKTRMKTRSLQRAVTVLL